MGRDRVGTTVNVGRGVIVEVGDVVNSRVGEIVGLGVVPFRLNRPKVRMEAASRRKRVPATPPMIQGSRSVFFLFFFTTSLKSDGTEIKTMVVLSWPPRAFARSINARAASFKFDFMRTISRISSFHTRSVRPSLHNRITSSGRIFTP